MGNHFQIFGIIDFNTKETKRPLNTNLARNNILTYMKFKNSIGRSLGSLQKIHVKNMYKYVKCYVRMHELRNSYKTV